MRKTLLTLAAVATTVSLSWADTTTLVFEGDGDVAGMTRIASNTYPTKDECSQDLSFSLEGFDCNFTSDLELPNSEGVMQTSTGNGFALFQNTTTKVGQLTKPLENGIYASSNINTRISVSLPGGTISAVKLNMYGNALSSLEIPFNGNVVAGEFIQANYYSWSWVAKEGEGSETVTMEWVKTAYNRFIHSIEITYTPALGDKNPCGLSFAETTVQGIAGQTFEAPALQNPNNLDITWTSSDESVATVDANGKVTPLAGGTTYITATTTGNDEYATGSARYTLTVVPAANSVAQMIEFAPAANDLVYVNCPLIVTYCNGSSAFVKDNEGNATLIWNTKNDSSTSATGNIYKVGDVIPAGWTATYDAQTGYKGLPEESTEQVEVTYPEVASLSYESDANKVLILKNVTFATNTNSDSWNGVDEEGNTYSFQNTYNPPTVEAGIYDVTLIVRHNVVNNRTFNWLAPLAYKSEAVAPEFPEEFAVAVSDENIEISQELEGTDYYIYVNGETEADTVTVTVEVPEGWDGFYAAVWGEDSGEGDATPYARAKASSIDTSDEDMWMPLEYLTEGMPLKDTNTLTFPVGEEGMSMGIMFLYKGDKALYLPINVMPSITKAEVAAAPEFPEEFVVAVSDENLEVSQELDGEDYYIYVNGETESDTVTVTVEVPEGWDGFYAAVWGEDSGEGDATPYARAKAASVDTSDEDMWMPLEYLTEGMPLKDTNTLTFSVGEEGMSMGIMFLYKGDNALYLPINVMPSITKPEPPAELEFPEELTISASVPGLSISQTRVDVDYTQVTIAGSTDAESVTITFEVPEGWDGFYGMTSSEFDPGDAEPLAKARKAAATDDEDMWMPAEMLPQMIPGMKKTNTLTFTTDEEEQTGMLFLYKGDQVYMHQIAVNFDVTTGIDAIEAVDSAARYFNLQGVEVKNPETGVYVKVANGKVSKVIVK